MNAAEALANYRETSDPAIIEAYVSFAKLPAAARQELLYFMICNASMILTGGATVTPVSAAGKDA